MQSKLIDFFQDEHGATAVEYGLMAFLISVVIFLAVTALGLSVRDLFNSFNEQRPLNPDG